MSNAESGDPKVNVQISFTNFLKNSVELTGVKKSGIQPTNCHRGVKYPRLKISFGLFL